MKPTVDSLMTVVTPTTLYAQLLPLVGLIGIGLLVGFGLWVLRGVVSGLNEGRGSLGGGGGYDGDEDYERCHCGEEGMGNPDNHRMH